MTTYVIRHQSEPQVPDAAVQGNLGIPSTSLRTVDLPLGNMALGLNHAGDVLNGHPAGTVGKFLSLALARTWEVALYPANLRGGTGHVEAFALGQLDNGLSLGVVQGAGAPVSPVEYEFGRWVEEDRPAGDAELVWAGTRLLNADPSQGAVLTG